MIHKHVQKFEEHLYVVFRVLVGLGFMLHGAQKFGLFGEMNPAGFAGAMGLPVAVGYLVSIVELVGGLGILAGMFTRLSALGGLVVMIGALALAHLPKGINPLLTGGELPMLYVAAFVVLLSKGAGMLSLEKALLKKEVF